MTDPRIQAALKAIEGSTPEPWIREGASVWALTPNTGSMRQRVPMVNRFYASVQRCNGDDGAGEDEVEANARQIALSPILPAALRLLEAVLEGQERDPIYLGPTIEDAAAEFLALLPAVEGEE